MAPTLSPWSARRSIMVGRTIRSYARGTKRESVRGFVFTSLAHSRRTIKETKLWGRGGDLPP